MLNPSLNIPALAAAFRERRRMQVRDILQLQTADALHDCLNRQVPWGLACLTGDKPRTVLHPEFAAMDEPARQALYEAAYERARDQFGFLYNTYMMVTAYKEGRDPHLLLHRVLEFLNTPAFLAFARTVTGVPTIVKVNAQATCYDKGHFLKFHNDHHAEEGREVAYVLNLTRKWQADWGGLLQFVAEDGSVEETLFPYFNSLTLFRVPMGHCVSFVSPFAEGARYAITGWFRSA